MVTTLSTKGQVFVPGKIRRELGLQPGDSLDVRLEGERIFLTPRKVRSRKARIIRDPITGLPVITAGSNSPKLKSADVREALADFP